MLRLICGNCSYRLFLQPKLLPWLLFYPFFPTIRFSRSTGRHVNAPIRLCQTQVGRRVHKDANGKEKHRFADKQRWKIHFQGFNDKAASLVCFLFHRGETNVRSRANDFFIVMKRMYAHEGKLPESSLNCKKCVLVRCNWRTRTCKIKWCGWRYSGPNAIRGASALLSVLGG